MIWHVNLDGAFRYTGPALGELTVLPSNDPVTVINTIRNNGERAQLGFTYTPDRKLRAFLNIDAGPAWHFLGDPSTETVKESRAIETPYPWNVMVAQFK